MAVVKSMRGEDKIHRRLLGRSAELTLAARESLSANQGMEASMALAQYGVRGGFVFLGCLGHFPGRDRDGRPLSSLRLYGTPDRHINNINKFLSKFPKCSASMERLENLFDSLEQYPEFSGEMAWEGAGALSLSKLSFSYGDGRDIFRNLDLEFPPGTLVAAVGESGSGKSTF